jgi:nicotinamidase/pyrazinamidase
MTFLFTFYVPLHISLPSQIPWSLVVLTQDWHPVGHVSFRSSHLRYGDFNLLDIVTLENGVQQVLWPEHCIQGSAGADFHASLNRSPNDTVIQKATAVERDAYSAFFEFDGVRSSGLDAMLKANGITDVYLAGFALDYCVAHTALHARSLSFNTWIVQVSMSALYLLKIAYPKHSTTLAPSLLPCSL